MTDVHAPRTEIERICRAIINVVDVLAVHVVLLRTMNLDVPRMPTDLVL